MACRRVLLLLLAPPAAAGCCFCSCRCNLLAPSPTGSGSAGLPRGAAATQLAHPRNGSSLHPSATPLPSPPPSPARSLAYGRGPLVCVSIFLYAYTPKQTAPYLPVSAADGTPTK